MIRYRFQTPADELEPSESPATATLTLSTTEPAAYVTIEYEGDPELIVRVRAHLRESHGARSAMNDEHTTPFDLNHAIHVSRQLDDYNPERIEDTVEWDRE